MMTKADFADALTELGLTQSELARLLGVTDRTVRRWVDAPEDIPGPATQAIQAWRRMKAFHISWRPDSLALGNDDRLAKLIEHFRRQPIDMKALLERVAARGGANAPWSVDVAAGVARLGLMTVEFYETPGDGFAPSAYRRSDGRLLDLERDQDLLDDAYVCIAEALKKRAASAKLP